MGVEHFVDGPVAGKRKAKRARVLLAAKLQTPSGEIEARLRDLSRKGALVECHTVPPKFSAPMSSFQPFSGQTHNPRALNCGKRRVGNSRRGRHAGIRCRKPHIKISLYLPSEPCPG